MASLVPRDREVLHSKLARFVDFSRIYFQPPASVHLSYPCFVYSMRDYDVRNANNKPYIGHAWYDVMYITRDPDDPVIRALSMTPGFNFGRWFAADDLNHYAFTYYSIEEESNNA
jgi:hypothetical protein